MKETSCLRCVKRRPGCHDMCILYIQYRTELEKTKAAEEAERKKVVDYKISRFGWRWKTRMR